MKRCFIYAHYDRDNEIKDYVRKQLKLLSTLGDILFISDSCEIRNVDYLPKCLYIQISRHGLYDAYSYFSGFNYLKNTKQLNNYDIIYFVNDSIIFPTCDEKTFIDKIFSMEYSQSNVWGMCKSHYLLQSYWLGCKKSAYKNVEDFINKYHHCTDNNLETWWNSAKNNPWILRKYNPRRKLVDEKTAKKWIYTVVNFETEFSKYMASRNMVLLGADDGTWINSKFITKKVVLPTLPPGVSNTHST